MIVPRRSLQARIVLFVATTVSALWIATAAYAWIEASHELDELLDTHLAQAAALLVAQASHEGEALDMEQRDTSYRYASYVAFQMWHEGTLRWRSTNAPLSPLSTKTKGFETRTIDGKAWRVFATEGAEHDVSLFVGERIDARDDILMAMLRGMFTPLAIALPLLVLAGWWAVRRGLSPLRALDTALAHRKAASLDPVTLDAAPREVFALQETLNRLFARINRLLENERRFTQDAAHELRTPIAAIRTQAQVALGASDAANRATALRNTIQGCNRAVHLVEQLLQLARVDASETSANSGTQATSDLVDVSRQVLANLAPAASMKRQIVELVSPEHCRIPGDAALLSALLRNLVDNAIRYSPTQATVCVTITCSESHKVRLRVEDSGAGLTAELQQQLGQRFVRGIGSGEDGSGLGWSIVTRIAKLLDLEIDIATSSSYGGLAVQLTWPQARTDAA